jgi:hypothetical protein
VKQTLLFWIAVVVFVTITVFAIHRYAHADECNPDLVSDRTPLCQLLKPQYRQCRPDRDINHDFDLLDGLCAPCPAGQCVTGVDPDTLALACSPCGCTGGGSCTPITCDPGSVLTAVDSGCGFTCTPLVDVCCAAGLNCCPGTTTTTESSSTTETTETSTSTTSTTVTTQPPGPSETFIWAPDIPFQAVSEAGFGSIDEMKCDAWVPDTGITNATQVTFGWLNSTSGVQCGVAIYSADGSSRLFSTGGLDCSTGSPRSVTGSAFSLVAGTKYLLCRCSNTTNLPTFIVTSGAGGSGTALSQIANTLAPAGAFTAANSCTAGSPPSTTGGSNGSDNHVGAVQLLIATTTP